MADEEVRTEKGRGKRVSELRHNSEGR
jgi:hypothetical protein